MGALVAGLPCLRFFFLAGAPAGPPPEGPSILLPPAAGCAWPTLARAVELSAAFLAGSSAQSHEVKLRTEELGRVVAPVLVLPPLLLALLPAPASATRLGLLTAPLVVLLPLLLPPLLLPPLLLLLFPPVRLPAPSPGSLCCAC